MIIGISGYIGSGKDTIAKVIQSSSARDWEIKKWAEKLKQIASLLTGFPRENFEDQEFKKKEMGAMWGMSIREFLQKLGTDAMREGLHKNVWVNALMSEYKMDFSRRRPQPAKYNKANKAYPVEVDLYPNWIISDTRFPNEAQAIKEAGGIVIRVRRPQAPEDMLMWGKIKHPSETSLDDWEFDEVIENDGTIEDLIPKVKEILVKYDLL